jgi:hypothetical protein
MPTSEKGTKMELTAEMKSIASGNLSATTIKVRDAVIQKCEGKDLEEMTHFIKQLLEHETNEQKRLGVLAARVYLLREKILLLKDDNFDDDSAENIKARHQDTISQDGISGDGEDQSDGDHSTDKKKKKTDWMRVQILENSEVNGIRFPSGVTIDVMKKDAEKLIEAGKAEQIQSDDEDTQDSDPSDQDDEGVSVDTSELDDAAEDDANDEDTPDDEALDNEASDDENLGDAPDADEDTEDESKS